MKYIILAMSSILVSFIFFACQKSIIQDDFTTITTDYTYFPTSSNQSKVYQIDSIIFQSTGTDEIKAFRTQSFIRETIVTSLETAAKDTLYRILQEWSIDNNNWKPIASPSIQRTTQFGIRTEQSQSIIKMEFPIKVGATWNSLAYIDPDDRMMVGNENIQPYRNWSEEVISKTTSLQLDSLVFEKVLELSYADTETLVDIRRVKEYYAPNVGLIYEEQYIMDTQKINPAIDWEEKAEKGFIVKKTLVAF